MISRHTIHKKPKLRDLLQLHISLDQIHLLSQSDAMDPIAHTLTGVALANAGVKQKVGKGSVLALIIASNLVDVDIFGIFFFEQPSWLYRRMWTHSLLTSPLLIILGAFVFSRLFQNARFTSWLAVFSLGVGFHIFMDLINSYGVVLFFPISPARFELAWVFIIDIYIWGILLFALLGSKILALVRIKIELRTVAKAGVLMLVSYMLACGALRNYSFSLLEQYASRHHNQHRPQHDTTANLGTNLDYSFSYVFPEPFGPWRFRGVLRYGSEYQVFLIKPLSNWLEYRKSYQSFETDPTIAKLIDSETGQKYQWFFKAPVWVKADQDSALVSDIRFKSLLLERGAPFTYIVDKTDTVGLKP